MISINERETFQFTEAGHSGVTGVLVTEDVEEELELILDLATIQYRQMEDEIAVDLIHSHGPVTGVPAQFMEATRDGVHGECVASHVTEDLSIAIAHALIPVRHMVDGIALNRGDWDQTQNQGIAACIDVQPQPRMHLVKITILMTTVNHWRYSVEQVKTFKRIVPRLVKDVQLMEDILSGLPGLNAMSPAAVEIKPVIAHASIHHLKMVERHAPGIPVKSDRATLMSAQ